MRRAMNPKVEKFRMRAGPLRSDSTYGNNGAFIIPSPHQPDVLLCIVSDGGGWDHLSAHGESGGGQMFTPSWDDMAFLKELFFEDDEVVMQLHPAKKYYINCEPHTLHLWRSQEKDIPTPPRWMIATDASLKYPVK